MVNRDDIIRIAIDAGINEATANFYCAEIGRLLAHEREECAKVCLAIASGAEVNKNATRVLAAEDCADLIRARGAGNESR